MLAIRLRRVTRILVLLGCDARERRAVRAPTKSIRDYEQWIVRKKLMMARGWSKTPTAHEECLECLECLGPATRLGNLGTVDWVLASSPTDEAQGRNGRRRLMS